MKSEKTSDELRPPNGPLYVRERVNVVPRDAFRPLDRRPHTEVRVVPADPAQMDCKSVARQRPRGQMV